MKKVFLSVKDRVLNQKIRLALYGRAEIYSDCSEGTDILIRDGDGDLLVGDVSLPLPLSLDALRRAVDSNGAEAIKIKGIHYGSTTVVAKTKDGGKVAVLNVKVTANEPFDVKLSHKEVSLIDGQTFQLSALVDAPVAMNKILFISPLSSIGRI